MFLDSIGEIIASRQFHLVTEGKPNIKIEVHLGKPRLFSESPTWYCPFQIKGIGAEEVKYASGVDAIQSIQLSMMMIGATLEHFNEKTRGRLRWLEGSEGDLGFPITVS